MSEIQNKTILLTGATGGLGQEMTKAFLEEGGKLILSDIDLSSLEKLKEKYSSYSKGTILGLIPADLSSEKGCKELYLKTKEIYGIPDFLINNAGIAVLGNFHLVPQEKWEKILNINLLAPMRLTYKFLPDFLVRRSGHIVNVSSVAGIVAVPSLTTYSVSKFGLKAFGEALEREVHSYGIQVTNFYPFFTRTPILDSEQVGFERKISVPDFLLSEPKDVIHELILGIKRNSTHVHPGGIAKLIEVVSRFLPEALQGLNALLLKQS